MDYKFGEITFLPFNVNKSMYLKSTDRIIACGNDCSRKFGNLTVFRSVSGEVQTEAIETLPGYSRKLELCESANGIFAVIGVNEVNGRGSLLIYDIQSNTQSLTLTNKSNLSTDSSLGHITGLSYDAYNGCIAASCDDGKIHRWDLQSEKFIGSCNGDAVGVSDIKYKYASTLVSAGKSNSVPFKIWDFRNGEIVSASFGFKSSHKRYIQCLRPHKIDDILATGSAGGDVIIWDLRNVSSCACNLNSIHFSQVNDVLFHPSKSNCVLSCGDDGRLLSSVTRTSYEGESSDVLMQEPGALSSLDCDYFANEILVSSELGPIFKSM